VGSIAGVFVAGFWFIDRYPLSTIFRLMGGLTGFLALLCGLFDYCWLARAHRLTSSPVHAPVA
jgi:hypothetical protein